MITHAGQIFNPASAHHNNRMLLQVVTFAGNIGRYFHPVCEPHTSNFSQSRVRFFWRRCKNLQANSSLKRRRRIHRPIFQGIEIIRKRRRFRFAFYGRSSPFHQLTNCRHVRDMVARKMEMVNMRSVWGSRARYFRLLSERYLSPPSRSPRMPANPIPSLDGMESLAPHPSKG